MWLLLVEGIRLALVAAMHLCGGSAGTAIIVVSLALRLALLPLTVWVARRAAAHQEAVRRLQPELDRIARRYASRPERLMRARAAAFRRAGIRQIDLGTMLGALAQAPVFAALYSAIAGGFGARARFLWVADLARPDVVLTLGVGAITLAAGLVAARAGTTPPRAAAVGAALSAVVAVAFLATSAAGLALYWGTSSAVGLAQTLVLQRAPARRGLAAG